ncbi:MAG: hybrid sensor histidine kinase/response regulator, partial [Proteobacteria bacterium]|nr:hybrid sensor histidine kinase/response regulator [Pseudomonadota bacterium]
YKTLELIYEQTVRGKNLTKNLVAFAKDQEPKQDYFKINEKIDLVLTLLKRDLEGIELIKDDKPGVPEVLADPGMIEHALVNLIQNSIHATSLTPSPRIWVRTYSLDNWICFDIEDNGCGIPDEHMENIFEPSFTLKGQRDIINAYDRTIKGTGYGMSNVKKYIEQHKGSITVQSKPGSGTSFTVRLPVLEKELTKKEKKLIRVSLPQTGKYILLVEDEQAISDVQYRVLTGPPFNHKVGLATNGQVAIDLFDRNPYDFISLDYLLPGKLNGMDVYHYVRQKNTTIPILFISGNIEFLESIKELKQKDPNIDHLSKPCRNLDYVETINKLMIKTLPKNK